MSSTWKPLGAVALGVGHYTQETNDSLSSAAPAFQEHEEYGGGEEQWGEKEGAWALPSPQRRAHSTQSSSSLGLGLHESRLEPSPGGAVSTPPPCSR